jgi:hypothetical protein
MILASGVTLTSISITHYKYKCDYGLKVVVPCIEISILLLDKIKGNSNEVQKPKNIKFDFFT